MLTYSRHFGPIDLLNTVPSFAMSFVVYYVYKRTRNDYTVIGTCLAYSAVLGVTVGSMLSYVLSLPLLPTIAYVAIGNVIASVLIGWSLFKVLKKIGVFRRWFPERDNRTYEAPNKRFEGEVIDETEQKMRHRS